MSTQECKWPRLSINFGMTDYEFSFVTNGASDPVVTNTEGRTIIASITHVSTGKYLVTLTKSSRYVTARGCEFDDDADDGAYATLGSVAGEAGSAISFNVFTRAASGTKTDFTGRRVSVWLAMKQSGVGS